MDETAKFAFEIKNPEIYRIACAIWPHLDELRFEDVKNHILVFDFDGDGQHALLGPGAIRDFIKTLEPTYKLSILSVVRGK